MWSFMGEAEEASLTAGEWERIYLLVNLFGLPHQEVEVDPSHCPTCRNIHAVVLLERETSLEEAVAAVSAMPTLALIDAFIPTGVEVGTVVERLQLLITASAHGVANEIRSVESASGDAATKTSLLQRAQQKLGVEGLSTGAIMSGALAGGIAVGGAAVAKFVTEGVDQFATLTGQVRGFQRVAGGSAEDASRLVFAVKDLGIQPDTAASAFGRLSTRIGTGKVDLADYGVEVAKNKDGSIDLAGTVANLSEAYQSTNDKSVQAALGNAAFGKSWQNLTPLLGKGKEDLKALYDEAAKDHQVFSADDLEAGRKYTLAVKQLGDAFTGLKIEAGQQAIPAVTSITSALTGGIHFLDQAKESTGGLVDVFAMMPKGVDDAGSAMSALTKVHPELIAKTGDLTQLQAAQVQAVKNLTQAQSEHGDKSKEAAQAEDALGVISKALAGKQDDLGTSVERVNGKLLTHAQNATAAANADLAMWGTQLQLEQATGKVDDAFKTFQGTAYDSAAAGDTYNEAIKRATTNHENLVGATLAAVQAAGQKAAADLGPNATAAERAEAATKAQKDELLRLEYQFPGLRDEVQGYTGDLDRIPPDVHTNIHVDTAIALQNARDLYDQLVSLSNTPWNIAVQMGNGLGQNYGGA